MEIKKTPDTTPAPLDDAELEEATGGAVQLRGGWDCPNCKATFGVKSSPCPRCGYES